MRQSIRPRAHKAGLECETVGGWLVDLLGELELQPQPGSDPYGVVSPEGRPSVEDVVSSLDVSGVVACGWMWRMLGGGSVRS